ncbi:MAG: nucleotide exchange factor GrpE [Elusimicrobia bacterium GWA2_56_46]|nr:MAG: nucleotide exchange factor GrpE [Elusimicrobia bacterium GWA2_56_46]OGR54290.1 MAG: nucleotide exchange factor GrpE [Elusimicrobia bacterium GWC2_56_31]HBW22424.1 nucleotide exchange factor GrpE [Elusimicrobiota bacterium]
MENKKHKHHEEKKNGGTPVPGGMECECDKNNECVCEEVAPAAGQQADKKAPAPDYYAQLLCVKADFENYRKRVEKEKPEFVKFGKAEILLRLLPLYDMLLQAHLHINKVQAGGKEEPGQTQDIVKGLEMIFKEFSKVFEAEGIRPMDLVGKPYDPMASEIIGIDEGTKENDGLVTEEFQKGFYYGDKILRPARVKIAKMKAPAPEAGGGQGEGEPEKEGK